MEKYIKNNPGYVIHLISSLLYCCILKSRDFNPTFTSKTTMLNFFNYLHPRLVYVIALLKRRPPTEPGWVLTLQLRSSGLSLLPLSTHLLPLPPHEWPLKLHDSLLHSLQWVWVNFLFFIFYFWCLLLQTQPQAHFLLLYCSHSSSFPGGDLLDRRQLLHPSRFL